MRIVVPIDGSTCSTFAVEALAHFTPPEELTLVHALQIPDFNYPMITPDLRIEAPGRNQSPITTRRRGNSR